MSRDIPIIFSAAMVLALLDGRKTMTRRLALKPAGTAKGTLREEAPSPWQRVQIGDRLWVRENLSLGATSNAWKYAATDNLVMLDWPDNRVAKLADWGRKKTQPYCPSIHMPRFVSRISLLVTGTKIERITATSEADAMAEGIISRNVIVDAFCGPTGHTEVSADRYWNGTEDEDHEGFTDPVSAYEDLWTRLHGADAWASDPEVVAISFKVVLSNIDALEARAA